MKLIGTAATGTERFECTGVQEDRGRHDRRRSTPAKVLCAYALGLAVAAASQAQDRRSLENCANGEPTTAAGLPDHDADGVADAVDNCRSVANSSQTNADGDAFGNVCDPDLDNNGVVNTVDLGLLKSVFFSTEPDLSADFDDDGIVAPGDLAIMRTMFNGPPGPAGDCVADAGSCEGPVDFEFDDIGEVAQGNLFVFRTADPATIYHARRLLDGSSVCNPSVSSATFSGSQSWNSNWGFHMDGQILFHGSSVEPLEGCDRTADFIQSNLAIWCGDDSETACQFWCPWRSKLTREVAQAGT